MISRVSEKTMHIVRWGLAIGWLVLIVSLFYDPISHHLTDPNNLLSPFRDHIISQGSNPAQCVKMQGECLNQEPYQMGARIFWGMVVPSAIMIVLVFGHETWRRICPLYFLSQIPRALGLPTRLKIDNNSWLLRNHLYLQFALLFIGLNCRILFINSARPVLGLFLILTILSAITVVFLYGGRSWCHYVCPFGLVQMVFTGPRGLLDSEAHKAPSKSITQSMCRTVDQTTGQEKSACISCKSSCLDIDSERAYWNDLTKPGRKLSQYGYLGLVIGYFVYSGLYAGNFDYYFSGSWTHDKNQLTTLLKPGFYIFNQPIAIPKLIAVPLTLTFFVGMSCLICSQIEKVIRAYGKRHNPNIPREQVLHQVFSLCTFVAFNTFFIYGGRPEILRLPIPLQLTFNALVVLVSSLWLYRTWGRSAQQYTKESLANSFRRQLKKLSIDFSKVLEGRCLDQLKPDELYVLAKVLPNSTQLDRWQIYKGVLQEALEEKRVEPSQSLEALKPMRQKLSLSYEDHYAALTELCSEKPHLLYPHLQQTPSLDRTVVGRSGKAAIAAERTEVGHNKKVKPAGNTMV
ncbi:MAG: 4Fe-4S binding protein [Symploca sp. SIO2C1]|nr:4Fe-4S binding protein [Symploca sp. SIO2C1]